MREQSIVKYEVNDKIILTNLLQSIVSKNHLFI